MNEAVDTTTLRELYAKMPEDVQRAFFKRMPTASKKVLLFNPWEMSARPDQKIPAEFMPGGGKLTWLPMAGRGWGKTRVGAETVIQEALSKRSRRIALVAETAADARDVMVDGPSGILACSPPWFIPLYEPSKRRVTWPNGVIGMTYNATEPNQLRGPQHDFAWCDELAKWRYAQETWDNLQFGLRIGSSPRSLITTTPRPIPLLRDILKDPTTFVTRGRTLDNRANLAATFMKKILDKYEGTRLGRQELDAELLEDMPGALWTRDMIEQAFVREHPPLKRIVVAIDPSGAADDPDTSNNEIGIVVAGEGVDGDAYVLDDLTVSASPKVWGAIAIKAYHRFQADCIVAEVNYGGAMVDHVIRSIDSTVNYRQVRASRGKFLRAEPVAALYEQGKVHHVGSFAEMEDQMVLIGPSGYAGSGSPDRLDAMVWAITELMLGDGEIRVIEASYG